MQVKFNKDLFPINKLPDVNCGEFQVQAYNGLKFKFERISFRTSIPCPILQYYVFDANGKRIGQVKYYARFFSVYLYGERILEMTCDTGELDEWADWQFVDCATTVIAAGYSKIGMHRERVRER